MDGVPPGAAPGPVVVVSLDSCLCTSCSKNTFGFVCASLPWTFGELFQTYGGNHKVIRMYSLQSIYFMLAYGFSFVARNTAQAQRLQVQEKHGPAYSARLNNATILSGGKNKPDGGHRKLECMAAVHQKEACQTTRVTVRSRRISRVSWSSLLHNGRFVFVVT